MPDFTTRVQVVVGGDSTQAVQSVKEVRQEVNKLAESMKKPAENAGAALGTNIDKGLKKSLKLLKKSAGSIGALLAYEVTNELGDKVEGKLKKALSGAMIGFGIGSMVGGGGGAVIGAGIGAVTELGISSLEKYNLQREEVKKLGAEFNITGEAAKSLARVFTGENGERIKKTFSDYVELINQFKEGSEKAKFALDGLLSSDKKGQSVLGDLNDLVRNINNIPHAVDKLAAIKKLPGGEQGFKDIVNEQKQLNDDLLKRWQSNGFIVRQTAEQKKQGLGSADPNLFTAASDKMFGVNRRDIVNDQILYDTNSRILKESQNRAADKQIAKEKDLAQAIEDRATRTVKAEEDYKQALEESVMSGDDLAEQLNLLIKKQKELNDESKWISDNEAMVLENKKEQLSVETKIKEVRSKMADQDIKRETERNNLINKQRDYRQERDKTISEENERLGSKWNLKDLINVPLNVAEQTNTNKGLLSIVGPGGPAGRAAVLWGREAYNARIRASMASLNGNTPFAINRNQWADKIESMLRQNGVLENDNMKRAADKLDLIDQKFNEGVYKLQVASGGSGRKG